MIHTANLNRKRDHHGLALDITVKSGDQTFAPTWEMVMGSKRGTLTWAQYTQQYTARMLRSQQARPQRWRQIVEQAAQGELSLLCYCSTPQHCHRSLLVDLLMEYGAMIGVPIQRGERK